MEWASQGDNRGGAKVKNKDYMKWTTRIAFSCLDTPALPCAYCKEQVLSWTQETEERQKREGRRRVAALTDPQSLETMTDWNHRLSLWWATQTVDTPKNSDAHFLFPASVTLPHLFKSTGKHAHMIVRQCITPAECSAWGLCLFGTSLSLSGSIALWLHNVPYHFHPIHLSLTSNTASGYTSHTTPPCHPDLM